MKDTIIFTFHPHICTSIIRTSKYLLYFNFNQQYWPLKFEIPINADIVVEKHEVRFKLHSRNTLRLWLGYLILSLVLIIISIYAFWYHENEIGFVFCLFGLIYLISVCRNYISNRNALSISRRLIGETTRRRERNHDISTWEFSDAEFRYKDMDLEIKMKWYLFLGYMQTEKYLFLFRSESIMETYCISRDEVGYHGFDSIIELVRQKMRVSYQYANAARGIDKIKPAKLRPGFPEELYRKNVREKRILYASIAAGVILIFFLMNYLGGRFVNAIENQSYLMNPARVPEYLDLFDSATAKNIFTYKTYEGKGFPVCAYNCDSKYNVVISKVKCDSGTSLKNIIHEEKGDLENISGSYYEMTGAKNKIWYSEEPVSSISSIYIRFSKGISDTFAKKENVLYYSIRDNDFSIRYGRDSSCYIYTETDRMLFEKKSPVPKEFMLLEKGDNIYILILFPANKNVVLKKGQLRMLLKKIE